MKSLLYISETPDAWRNLAVDEYFLDHVAPDECLLYFYVNGNAVIIGRGQNPWAECRLTEMERDGVQLVRRISGGGAVYHDLGNLNFSFIMGSEFYDVKRQLNTILSAVRSLGIPCDFSGRNDLLANGRKFSGNAFCARGNIRQHHGTLLISSDMSKLQNYLNVDIRKLRTKGAHSVRSRVCNLNEFNPDLTITTVLNALCEAFKNEYGPYQRLNKPDECDIHPYLLKQASAEWRLGKSPRFDVEIENRFTWGNAQLQATLREGRVDSIKVFSDSMDPQFSEDVSLILKGVRYGSATMGAALLASEKSEIRELAAYIISLDF